MLQVTALQATMIGSRTCLVMSSLRCRLLSTFGSYWRYRLCTVEKDGACNASTAWTDRQAWPGVRAVGGNRLIRYSVNGGVPSEGDEGCGCSTNSHIDCL